MIAVLQFCCFVCIICVACNEFNTTCIVLDARKKVSVISHCRKNYLPPFSILRDHWGVFHQEKTCVSAAVNHTIYGVSTKLLLLVKEFCVFKISVIVHNTYCVKCSLSYTADYTGNLPEKSFIFWLIRR